MSDVAPQRSLTRFDGIQLLRFVAAALVLVAHATIYTHERLDASVPVWDLGGAGVDIFFVISGFVIVLAARGKTKASWVSWRSFLMKRALRIFPMYWLATALNLLILLALPGQVLHSSFQLGEAVQWFLLIPTRNDSGRIEPLLGVGWTLYFETFFYLLFALSLALRRSPFLLLPPILIGCALLSALKGSDWPAAAIYLDPKVLEFLAGMVIAAASGRLVKAPRFGLLLALAGAALLASSAGTKGLVEFAFRASAATSIVAGFVAAEPLLRRHVGAPLLFLGAASYALYLLHPIFSPAVPVVLKHVGLDSVPLSLLGCIAAGLVVAAVAHRWLEAPLLARGSAWLRARGADVQPDRNVPPELPSGDSIEAQRAGAARSAAASAE